MNNDKKFILTVSIGFGLYYYIYKCKKQEIIDEIEQNDDDDDDNTNIKQNKNNKKTKQVRFNENIEYQDTDTIETFNSMDDLIDLALISDNLLNTNINNINNKNNSKNDVSVASVDREKMFLELENEIDNQYKSFSAGGYNTVEFPLMNNLIVNSNEIKNSDINPIINPNVYNVQPDDNLTIWEHYDRVTTNNYKQFVNIDDVNPNIISDSFMLGNNSDYGATNFDTYSK
jgi:hypothetical protein